MGLILYLGGGHAHHHHVENNHGEHVEQNINVRAAFIHVLGDLLQSVGVLVAALLILYNVCVD